MNIPQLLKYLKHVHNKYGGEIEVKVRVRDETVEKLTLPIQQSDLKLMQMNKTKSIVLVIDMT